MTEPRDIHIHAGEEPVITTALAAKRWGVSTATMRSTLARLKASGTLEPVPEALDERTPLYPLAALELAMGTRPGKGANLRAREQRPLPELTPARQPAYNVARSHIQAANWSEEATERAALEVAVLLERLRKEAGRAWKSRFRQLEDHEERWPLVAALMEDLRSLGTDEARPAALDAAIRFGAQHALGR